LGIGSWEFQLTALYQQVRRTIRRHDLCPPGTRVLVALSGGSDSVALTRILEELAANSGFSVAALAHLNHRLRPTARRDEQFCRDFAAQRGLAIVVDAVDVQTYAAAEKLSVENAARRVRYTFLHRAAADVGADRIAVGQTRDDQAETLLLKLIRGAGLAGLGGIYPRRGVVIRPLLEVSRAELREYLTRHGQRWVEDESNEELSNPRNRIRHRVLPELELAYGAAARSIARAAGMLREDGQWLDEWSRRRFGELGVVNGSERCELDAAALAREPMPVQRRILLSAMRAISPECEIGLDHVEMALDVLHETCAAADVPGGRLELRRGKLVLSRVGQG
jgi:tRNA(Ile)-lysidine synthase